MVDIQGAQLKSFSAYLAERQASTDGVSMVPGLDGAETGVVAVSPSFNSIRDFGAVGDGTTDDTAAINASAANGAVFLPAGTYSYPGSDFGAGLGAKRLLGVGQIKTGVNTRAPYFSAIQSAPVKGSENSIDTAFNGDVSKVQFAVEHRITGAATLGQPTSGYEFTPEAYPHYTYLYNASGHNESLAGNGGRTAAAAYRVKLFQGGQGDAICYNASAFVTGTKAGSTDFLANPAAGLFAGGITAGADGVYFNPYETNLNDSGFDVAAIGAVYNFTRTVSTGAKSAVWGGARFQSQGSAFCDAIISATGKWKTGIDFAMAGLDFDTTLTAISLKAGQKIAFNNAAGASGNLKADWRTTTFSSDCIYYDTGQSRLFLLVGGAAALTLHASQVANFGLGVNVAPTKTYQVAGSNVVGARKTGWTVDTGTAKRTANATYSATAEVGYTQATIQALMDAVRDATQTIKALKDDLHNTAGHGLIGT